MVCIEANGARPAPSDSCPPVYSLDWLQSMVSEEAVDKKLDAHQRIEEAMRERRC
jgi:hypothetical protein